MMFIRNVTTLTKITLVACFFVFLNPTPQAKTSPLAELHQTGLYGRVHAWNKVERYPHFINVKVPRHAPIIISDFHSTIGANGFGRSGKHKGVDIFAKTGTPIIAAADGIVMKANVDECWGPTVLIKHGPDHNGRPLHALYGHMRNISVKAGQRVKRGQQIAEMGEALFTGCGAGLNHLHFQLSYRPNRMPIVGWGWANFVRDGFAAPNPHKFWENGIGKVTCFEKNKQYSTSGLTYPVPCNNALLPKKPDKSIFVQNRAIQNKIPRLTSPSPKEVVSNKGTQDLVSTLEALFLEAMQK